MTRARLGLLILLGACDPAEPATLHGREFFSESVEGRELVAGTRIAMRFDDEHGFSASAGCNSMGSETYELAEGRLVLGPLSMTEKGCEAPLHEQDEWLSSFLGSSPAYVLEEPRLTLSDDDVTIVLLDSEVADPDRELQGPIWTVNGLIDGMGVGIGEAPVDGTLEFRDDGTLAIITPCAPGTADFSVDGTAIALSGVSFDDVACPDDENAVMIDAHMREVLADGALEHEIDAGRLTLMRGDIGLYLTTE